jgi:hypothetical protein
MNPSSNCQTEGLIVGGAKRDTAAGCGRSPEKPGFLRLEAPLYGAIEEQKMRYKN